MGGLRYRRDRHEGGGSHYEGHGSRHEDDRGKHHDEPDKDEVLGYFESRFGLDPSVFDGYVFYIGGRGRLYLGPSADMNGLRVATTGLTIARSDGGIKPTTNLLQCFGSRVTKNRIDISRADAAEFIRGSDIRIDPAVLGDVSDGYVLLVYQGCPLGCGLLKQDCVKNMLPKAKRLNLQHL